MPKFGVFGLIGIGTVDGNGAGVVGNFIEDGNISGD